MYLFSFLLSTHHSKIDASHHSYANVCGENKIIIVNDWPKFDFNKNIERHCKCFTNFSKCVALVFALSTTLIILINACMLHQKPKKLKHNQCINYIPKSENPKTKKI